MTHVQQVEKVGWKKGRSASAYLKELLVAIVS